MYWNIKRNCKKLSQKTILKLVYLQKIKANMKSWCAENQKLISLQYTFSNFDAEDRRPLLYGIGIFKENCMKFSVRFFSPKLVY